MKQNVVNNLVAFEKITLCINPVKPSATMKIGTRERGSPCLNPFPTLKSPVGLPFTNTDIEL
jgi:hypothetical protein